MFFARKPSAARARAILETLADRAFTFPDVGLTRGELESPPAGFTLDAYGVALGHGAEIFARACELVSTFRNYPRSFTEVIRVGSVLEEGHVFGTLAAHFGFASLHPCRVAYLMDEKASGRFGFGLATLPGHIERGEERFLVTLNPTSEEVRYEVQAVSRPDGLLPMIGKPIIRAYQFRFQRETVAEMRRQAAPEGGEHA